MKKQTEEATNQLTSLIAQCDEKLRSIRENFKRYLSLIFRDPSLFVPNILAEYLNSSVLKSYFLYLDYETTYKWVTSQLEDIKLMHVPERHTLFRKMISERHRDNKDTLLDDFNFSCETNLKPPLGFIPSVTPTTTILIHFIQLYGNVKINSIQDYLNWFYPNIKNTVTVSINEIENHFSFEIDEHDLQSNLLSSVNLEHLAEFKPLSDEEIIHIQFLNLYKNTPKREPYLFSLNAFLSEHRELYEKLKRTNWFQPYYFELLYAIHKNDLSELIKGIIDMLSRHREGLGDSSIPLFSDEMGATLYPISTLLNLLEKLSPETSASLDAIPLFHEKFSSFMSFKMQHLFSPTTITLDDYITVLKHLHAGIKEQGLSLIPNEDTSLFEHLIATLPLPPYYTAEPTISYVSLNRNRISHFINDFFLFKEMNEPFISPILAIAFLLYYGEYPFSTAVTSHPAFFKEKTLSLTTFHSIDDSGTESATQRLIHHFDHLFVGPLPSIYENYEAILEKYRKIPYYLETPLILSLPIHRDEYKRTMCLKELDLDEFCYVDGETKIAKFISFPLSRFITSHYRKGNLSEDTLSCYVLGNLTACLLLPFSRNQFFKNLHPDELEKVIQMTLKNTQITIRDLLLLLIILPSDIKKQFQARIIHQINSLSRLRHIDSKEILTFDDKKYEANIVKELLSNSEIRPFISPEKLLSALSASLNSHVDKFLNCYRILPYPHDESLLNLFIIREKVDVCMMLFSYFAEKPDHTDLPESKTEIFASQAIKLLDEIIKLQWKTFLAKLKDHRHDPEFSDLFQFVLKPYLDQSDSDSRTLVFKAIIEAQVPFQFLIKNFKLLNQEQAQHFVTVYSEHPSNAYNLVQHLFLLCSDNLPVSYLENESIKLIFEKESLPSSSVFYKIMSDFFHEDPDIIPVLLQTRFVILKPILINVKYLDSLISAIPDSIRSQTETAVMRLCEADKSLMRQLCHDLSNYHHYFDLYRAIFRQNPDANHFIADLKIYLTLPHFFEQFFMAYSNSAQTPEGNEYIQFLTRLFKENLYDRLIQDQELQGFLKQEPHAERFLDLIEIADKDRIQALLEAYTEETNTTLLVEQPETSHKPLSPTPLRLKRPFFLETSPAKKQDIGDAEENNVKKQP